MDEQTPPPGKTKGITGIGLVDLKVWFIQTLRFGYFQPKNRTTETTKTVGQNLAARKRLANEAFHLLQVPSRVRVAEDSPRFGTRTYDKYMYLRKRIKKKSIYIYIYL